MWSLRFGARVEASGVEFRVWAPRLRSLQLVTLEEPSRMIDMEPHECGEFAALRAANPAVESSDWRGGFILPGFVDAHVHFPQIRVIGSLGRTLLDWLEHVALPEEARMTLMYLPYVPSLHEDMILRGRRILADQMDFLLASVPRSSRLHG